MKFWLLIGATLLVATSAVQAGNYRIVQSPSQKLDVWIDDIKNNTPQSWCANELALRIVANGNKNVTVLNDFMPRLGMLLAHQCTSLKKVNWTLVDASKGRIAQGSAEKSNKWALEVSDGTTDPTPQPVAEPVLLLPESNAEVLSPAADRTQWQEFMLLGGCRLRTFWQDETSAFFIPKNESNRCEHDGWLNGRHTYTQLSNGMEESGTVTFVQGFPVIGFNDSIDASELLVITANNERMVISHKSADHSWLILPYISAKNSWKIDGTLAIKISHELANDSDGIQARIDAARKVWMPWLAAGTQLNVVLIDALHPRLSNPAVSSYRAVH
ncbi:hypothetical protein [Scandinavium manionii]|uniref:hypothetical protein n=1 Tax=Scandinavium manionii TaxID=2926520 RepID=UPI00135BFC0E|nr:hypothetical protein [Scandinavium manionii]MCS2164499.1 hypothetical protein [Scandinavium manionii]